MPANLPKKNQNPMTKKQAQKTPNTAKPASTKPPQPSQQKQAAKAWREKNVDHVRNYKRAYRQKQKATDQNKVATIHSLNEMVYQMSGTLNMQMLGVGSGIRDILEAIDRIEVIMHQLQNGAAIKPKISSPTKMFAKQ
jgi:Lon protease-like protein